MGAGKTNIGRRLAARLRCRSSTPSRDRGGRRREHRGNLREHGEAYFREGERRVIARLLDGRSRSWPPAAAPSWTRLTRSGSAPGISIWLRADLDLWSRGSAAARTGRCSRRRPADILAALIERRHPIYAEADIVVDSSTGPPEATLGRVLAELKPHIAGSRRFPPRATAHA